MIIEGIYHEEGYTNPEIDLLVIANNPLFRTTPPVDTTQIPLFNYQIFYAVELMNEYLTKRLEIILRRDREFNTGNYITLYILVATLKDYELHFTSKNKSILLYLMNCIKNNEDFNETKCKIELAEEFI